jgi:hypothetical protein
MNQEELKTAIGHLQLDLRGNWGWDYTRRLEELIRLLIQLEDGGESNSLISKAQGEIEDPSDGRIFRGGYLYGYESEEGRTQEVYDYLEGALSHPEYNNIEVSLLYKREQKLNDLGI